MARQEEKSGQIFDVKILKRIFSFTKPYRKRFWFLVLIILLLACVIPLSPILIKNTIDNQIASGNYKELALMVLAMVGLLILQGILNFFSAFLSGWLGQTIIRDIRIQLYQKILQLRLKFFDETPIGRLVTRTVSDIETLSDVFSDGLAQIFGDIMQLILIIGVMFYTDWRLSLISLTTVPLMLISTYIFKEYIKKSL